MVNVFPAQHMAFCSSLAFLIVACGFVEKVKMDTQMYLRCVGRGQAATCRHMKEWPAARP